MDPDSESGKHVLIISANATAACGRKQPFITEKFHQFECPVLARPDTQ